ncbi:DUF4249 domain-containing protein [Aestuariibaculum lutulentum]|uniref:DUF4249 domain-containing protein n=1 Tax=Aestuariibaculum lutulentum TaxID=2920935 RepID=A0ABS9RGR4_9FLAO|nr:DUF4249 domain-containing protein [Aestuariibaculum lutulentum]MCH4552136.1 DUF4249 domain-containing protein [Aestuariibaculum lutulentum]
MKRYIKNIAVLIIASLGLFACEDVIDVEVQTGQIRLVIEASLDWEKGTLGNNQTIKLSTSTPYFETANNTAVTNATVMVTNLDTNEVFNFVNQNDGTYTTDVFVPVENNQYQLEVVYNNETYIATETLMPVPDINDVNQSVDGGIDPDLLEVNIYFDDPADEDNFYLIRYYEEGDLFPYFEDYSDEFSNGNEVHDFFEKQEDEDNDQAEFQPGDSVDISLYGISERYYNYMRILIEQYYSGGNPFSSNGVQLKGNCVNATNQANYPYGYFRATQVVKTSYTFQ